MPSPYNHVPLVFSWARLLLKGKKEDENHGRGLLPLEEESF